MKAEFHGRGLVYLEEHKLLAYVGELTRVKFKTWAAGMDSFRLYDPQPWGNDWESPFIRQVYLELMGGRDLIRHCTGSIQGHPTPQRLDVFHVEPLEGHEELRYHGPASVMGPLQDVRYRWYVQFNVAPL
jgi:hypothetical protein